jgi:nucleoside diphosphate kinase
MLSVGLMVIKPSACRNRKKTLSVVKLCPAVVALVASFRFARKLRMVMGETSAAQKANYHADFTVHSNASPALRVIGSDK